MNDILSPAERAAADELDRNHAEFSAKFYERYPDYGQGALGPRYFDRQGQSVSFGTFAVLHGKDDYRVVAEDRITMTRTKKVRVSTVWLGLDHGYPFTWKPRALQIFESMCFWTNSSGEVTDWGGFFEQRYSTEADALVGHYQLLERIKGSGYRALLKEIKQE